MSRAERPLSADVVVVSPHLDDAVLSLGASIARAARKGRRIVVLTVFAGNPDSHARAGGWDRGGGFRTEGEAATARRLEDEEACRVVGAEPSWLSFSEADYRTAKDPEDVCSAVLGRIGQADVVLVPGFPLTNPDHAWLSDVLVDRGLPCRRVGLYAEQPYRYKMRGQRRPPDLSPFASAPGELAWIRSGLRVRDLWTKRRALLAYRSQLPLLGLAQDRSTKLYGMLLHEILQRGEAIAWLPRR